MTRQIDDTGLDRLLASAAQPPQPPMARIEAGALAGFDAAISPPRKLRWPLWGAAIAAALALAIAVPVMLDLSGNTEAEQPTMAATDADAFAAALVGTAFGEETSEDALVQEVLSEL